MIQGGVLGLVYGLVWMGPLLHTVFVLLCGVVVLARSVLMAVGVGVARVWRLSGTGWEKWSWGGAWNGMAGWWKWYPTRRARAIEWVDVVLGGVVAMFLFAGAGLMVVLADGAVAGGHRPEEWVEATRGVLRGAGMVVLWMLVVVGAWRWALDCFADGEERREKGVVRLGLKWMRGLCVAWGVVALAASLWGLAATVVNRSARERGELGAGSRSPEWWLAWSREMWELAAWTMGGVVALSMAGWGVAGVRMVQARREANRQPVEVEGVGSVVGG